MNQILYTGGKNKRGSSVDIKKIIIFFVVLIIIFAIAAISIGINLLVKVKNENKGNATTNNTNTTNTIIPQQFFSKIWLEDKNRSTLWIILAFKKSLDLWSTAIIKEI